MRKILWAIGVLFVLRIFVFPTFDTQPNAATEDYEGSYSLTFSGDMNGIAIVRVESTGALQGVIWVEAENTVDYVAGWASIDEDGAFSFFSMCGIQVEGNIAVSGEMSGTWDYNTDAGTFSGQLDTGSLNAYSGSYTVHLTGDITDQWSIDIDSEGNITGEMASSGEAVFMGMVDSQGNIICITDEWTSAWGTIDTAGNISGTWESEDHTLSGAFTSQAASSGSSGGGGGCFLSTLLPNGLF